MSDQRRRRLRMSRNPALTTQIMSRTTNTENARNSQSGTMLGISIDDWFTYTNVAYLLSLVFTLFLSVAPVFQQVSVSFLPLPEQSPVSLKS